MEENMMKNSFLLILPFALIADIVIPFLLALPYKEYSHAFQVMSVLGNNKSPLHIVYNCWLILLGVVILISSFAIYDKLSQHSKILATLLLIVMIIYAIGGCILSGIFQVGETKSLETISEKIHGYGSVIGFMLLTFAPLLCGLYLLKRNCTTYAIIALICFILALVFFVLFVMSDKAEYKNTIIALEGMLQRLTLLFMYIPIAEICLLSFQKL